MSDPFLQPSLEGVENLMFEPERTLTLIQAVGRSFWVAGGGAVRQHDRDDGLVAEILLPGTAVALTASESVVWVATTDDSGVVAIDASSKAVLGTVPLDEEPSDIALVGSSVWVTQASSLVSMSSRNPRKPTLLLDSEIPLVWLLAGAAGECFALDEEQEFALRFDESGEQLGDWIELGDRVDAVVFAANSLWAGYRSNGALHQFDGATGSVVNEWTTDPLRPIEWLSGETNRSGVWFADQEGRLTKINPVAGAVTGRWDLKCRVDFLVAMNDELWGGDEHHGHLFRIDSALRSASQAEP